MRQTTRAIAVLCFAVSIGLIAGVTISPLVQHMMVAAKKSDRLPIGRP